MDSLLLSSDGFSVGWWHIPAFQLRMGECVCLHLPEAMASAEVEQLIRVLTGKTPLSGVQLFGRVSWAAPLRNRRLGLSGLFRSMRVADWLSRIAGATLGQAQAILEKLHPSERGSRIEQLAGTPQTLLSVELTWLTGAEVVVFTTAGLDPLGREAVYDAVCSHFRHGSAIHLSFPVLQNEQRSRRCFQGTTCLELMPSTELPRSATTSPRTT